MPECRAAVLGTEEPFSKFGVWQILRCWHSYLYVTDGYPVYPCFISSEEHIVSKTYMTRVEGENSRLRHYLALTTSQNFLLLKVRKNAIVFNQIGNILSQVSLGRRLQRHALILSA